MLHKGFTTSHDRHTIVVRTRRGRTTIARLYKTMLASHHVIIVKSCAIARLSYDCRTIDLLFSFSPGNHSEVVSHHTTIVRLSFNCRTMSYDLPTISHTLPMRRKASISSVTTTHRTTSQLR